MLLLPMLYLPPVSYMALLCAAGEVHIEAQENYIKSTYRNRCEIAGANGVIALSIPLEGGRDHHQLYRDSRISYTDHWQHRHMMSILSSYGSAPFYEHYIDYFKPFYTQRFDKLFEFNQTLLMLMIRLMKLEVTINNTGVYERDTKDRVDLRNAFKPNKSIDDISLKDGRWYLQEVPYIKVFGELDALGTQLSCLDLLFNVGPESKSILNGMIRRESSK